MGEPITSASSWCTTPAVKSSVQRIKHGICKCGTRAGATLADPMLAPLLFPFSTEWLCSQRSCTNMLQVGVPPCIHFSNLALR